MSGQWGRWPPPAKPIAVKDGLTTRRRQGAIGDTWWSKRFIEVLESFGIENRLARGRAYARKGKVISLDVQRGTANAVVQGSRARPYRVVIGVDELSDGDWEPVSRAFAEKAVFLAKLLAGEMPQNIEEAFAACSLTLFPKALGDLETVCSCPDNANPCKHIAAALYLLAESFDEDPFRIFEWRGRTKADLLASLHRADDHRGHIGNSDSAASIEANEDIDDLMWGGLCSASADKSSVSDERVQCENFWGSDGDLASIGTDRRLLAHLSAHADVLLRQLEPFPRQLGDATLVDLLVPAYRQFASNAADRTSTSEV